MSVHLPLWACPGVRALFIGPDRLPRTASMLLVLAVLVVPPAAADTIVLTLDEPTIPAGLQCGEVWTESGLDLVLRPHPPACFVLELCEFSINPYNLALSPGILEVDLAGVPGPVTSAAVLADSPCGTCVTALLYEGTTVVDSANGGFGFPSDTLVVLPGDAAVDRLVIEGCYASALHEIRIEYEPAQTSVGDPAAAGVARLESRPNPFRAATRLSFRLETAGHVRLVILDVRGRLVRTLVDGAREPGTVTEAWDGRDTSGRKRRPGIYVAALAVDGRRVGVAKLMITR